MSRQEKINTQKAVLTPRFYILGYLIGHRTEGVNITGDVKRCIRRELVLFDTQIIEELFFGYNRLLLNVGVESLDLVTLVLNIIGSDFSDWGRVDRERRRRRRTRATFWRRHVVKERASLEASSVTPVTPSVIGVPLGSDVIASLTSVHSITYCTFEYLIISCLYLTIYVVYCNVFVSYNTISYIAVYPIAPQIVI